MTLQDSAQVSTSTHLKNEANSDILDRAHNNNFISSHIHIQEQPNAMAVQGIDCKPNKTRAHTAKT